MKNFLLPLIAMIGCVGFLYMAMRPAPEVTEHTPLPDRKAADHDSAADQRAAASSARTKDFELDQAVQDRIWQAEHVTFEIEHKLGPRIKNNISTHSIEDIKDVLRPEFSGSVIRKQNPRIRTAIGITETTFQAAQSQTSVGADEFIRTFFDDYARIAECGGTSMRVLSIFETDQHQWDAKVLLTAVGRTQQGGYREVMTTSDVRFRFEQDKDLLAKPVIQSWNESERTVRTGGDPLFEEVTNVVGLDKANLTDNWQLEPQQAAQYRFQLAVEDWNRDGWLDIAVATEHNSMLLQWNPSENRFLDVSDNAGIAHRHTPLRKPRGKIPVDQMPVNLAAWLDFNNDGFPDLVLGNRLYRNDAGRALTDITRQSGLEWNLQSMGATVADYDADGFVDLYIVQQGTEETVNRSTPLGWINDDQHGQENRLWRNKGNGTFADVTDVARAGGGKGHSLAACWFHFNDDRFPDLYIANDFNKNVLLKNLGNGTFADVSAKSGAADYATSMGVADGDVNNDGRTDLYVANMFSKMGRRIIGYVTEDDYPPGVFAQIQGSCSGNRLYLHAAGGERFEDQGEIDGINAVGWAYAPSITDFDNDGWQDLYATTGFLSFERKKPDG